MPSSRQHIGSIDLLRGLAALAVCFYHFTKTAANGEIYLPDGNFLKMIGSYGDLGVTSFFVISGFVIPWSMYNNGYTWKNFGGFLAKRSIRIELPYLASILLILAVDFLFTLGPSYTGPGFSVDGFNLLLHIGYLVPFFHQEWLNPIFWTLAIEFQYYILMAVLFPLLVHPGRVVRYLLLLVLFVLGILVMDWKWVFHYLLLFLPGILVFLVRTRQIGKAEFFTGLLIVFLSVLFKLGLPSLVAVIIPVVFIYFPVHIRAVFWGNISYSLYLVHGLAGGHLIYLSRHFIQSEIHRSAFVFVAVLFSIGVAWIFYRLVEKPSIRLSHRIKYRRREKRLF